MMHLTYEHKPAMTLIGFSTLIRMEEGYTRCPEFWDVEYNRKYARLWQTGRPETPVEQALLESRIGRFAICRRRTTAPKRQRPPRCWGFYKRWRGGIRGGDAGRPGWPGSTIRVRP